LIKTLEGNSIKLATKGEELFLNTTSSVNLIKTDVYSRIEEYFIGRGSVALESASGADIALYHRVRGLAPLAMCAAGGAGPALWTCGSCRRLPTAGMGLIPPQRLWKSRNPSTDGRELRYNLHA
jgi:hypothetical protein